MNVFYFVFFAAAELSVAAGAAGVAAAAAPASGFGSRVLI